MINACSSCEVCKGGIKHTKFKGLKDYQPLVTGELNSSLLIVGSFLDFEKLYDYSEELALSLQNTFDSYSLTFVTRCSFGGKENQSAIDACSVYTKFVARKFNCFLITKDGYKQFNLPEEFELNKIIKHKNRFFIMCKDLREWTNDDRVEYKQLIDSLTKE